MRDFSPTHPRSPQSDYLVAPKNALWAPQARSLGLCLTDAGANALPDIPRSISANAANKCNRNLDIGLSAPVSMTLGRAEEPDSQGNQLLDRPDAMRHAAAPAIELPDQHGFEPAEPGVAKELVEPRPAGGRRR